MGIRFFFVIRWRIPSTSSKKKKKGQNNKKPAFVLIEGQNKVMQLNAQAYTTMSYCALPSHFCVQV